MFENTCIFKRKSETINKNENYDIKMNIERDFGKLC